MKIISVFQKLGTGRGNTGKDSKTFCSQTL